jgi:hypothetical protein
MVGRVRESISRPTGILPLVLFRIIFGLLMALSAARFVAKGWVEELYLAPSFHFPYYGFEWLQPPGNALYLVFALMGAAALFISLGLFYRLSTVCYFLLFTYVELLDKTYYLNHYYFVSLISFLMIWLPAGRYLSLDARRNPRIRARFVPRWAILAIQLQIGLVYFFAGLAKLNPDWLLQAMPLRIWLPARAGFPVFGLLFDQVWFAYFVSWAGAAFDLAVPFLLAYRRTRPWAYLTLVGFHLFTGWLFPIGVFPWVMIGSALIFFDEEDYRRLGIFFRGNPGDEAPSGRQNRLVYVLLGLYFGLQLALPLRHALYPGNVLWTEEGFRWSWRVMLVEKTGTATFFVTDPASGRTKTAYPGDYLTPQQEKQMSFQPDMILAFAHYLRDTQVENGLTPIVRAEVSVSLNGRAGQLLVDPGRDLSEVDWHWGGQDWLLPLEGE